MNKHFLKDDMPIDAQYEKMLLCHVRKEKAQISLRMRRLIWAFSVLRFIQQYLLILKANKEWSD